MGIIFYASLQDYDAITGGDALITSQSRLQYQSMIWHQLYSRQLALTLGEVNWGTTPTLDFLLALMDQSGGGGFLLTGYATDSSRGFRLNGGHTVAFWYDAAGVGSRKAFFDPNFGQYSAARDYYWKNWVIDHLSEQYTDFNQWVLFDIV